jgi:hypothetical protein
VEEEQEGVALPPELVALGGRGRHESGEARGLGLHAPELRLVRGARRVELGQRAHQRAPELRRRREGEAVQLAVAAAGMVVEGAGAGLLVVVQRVSERGAMGRMVEQGVLAAVVFHLDALMLFAWLCSVLLGFGF